MLFVSVGGACRLHIGGYKFTLSMHIQIFALSATKTRNRNFLAIRDEARILEAKISYNTVFDISV